MIKNKLFVSLYIGFLVYIALKSLFGTGGFSDYSSLVHYKNTLNQNLKRLEIIYHDLYHDLKSLKSNAQIVKLYSRELGYFEPDEHVISSPKSSRGRLFLRTRLLADYNPCFDEIDGSSNFLIIGIFLVLRA